MLNETLIKYFSETKFQAEEFYKQRIKISENFNFDVSSSTYRVFRNTKEKPSLVFKKWAFTTIQNNNFFKDILNINSKDDFNEFHKKYLTNLALFWGKEQEEILATPYKYKLTDLFLKSLTICDFNDNNINEKLINYCNLPLDSITLNALDKITSGQLGLKAKTMGFIKNEEIYIELQNCIANICEKVGVNCLYFDFFSKNIKKIKLYQYII